MWLALLLVASPFECKDNVLVVAPDKPVVIVDVVDAASKSVLAKPLGALTEVTVDRCRAVQTATLLVEDLGPIARAPAPPRWKTNPAKKLRGYAVSAPGAPVALTLKQPCSRALTLQHYTLEQIASRRGFVRQGVAVEGAPPRERKRFGEWVPLATLTTRYSCTPKQPVSLPELPVFDWPRDMPAPEQWDVLLP